MNLKDKILGVAKELFIKNGYNATTTGEIVKLSESSKGNLYYHFKTKENLFLEILNIEESKWQEQCKGNNSINSVCCYFTNSINIINTPFAI